MALVVLAQGNDLFQGQLYHWFYLKYQARFPEYFCKSFGSCNNCAVKTLRMVFPWHLESNISCRVCSKHGTCQVLSQQFYSYSDKGDIVGLLWVAQIGSSPQNSNLFALGTLLKSLFRTSFYGDRHVEENSLSCQYRKWLLFYEISLYLYLMLCGSWHLLYFPAHWLLHGLEPKF